MKLFTHDGQRSFLEFLRNLTPQVLLLSAAIVLYVSAVKPDAKSPGWLLGLAIGAFLIWCLAFSFNLDQFLSASFTDAKFISAEKRRVILTMKNPVQRIWNILASIAAHSKITFAELLLALLVVYGAMFVVLISAVSAASKALS